ncbi:N-acetylmuramidase domain-containing protein [Sphingobium subterraneum]|nr:N-acetylmuramidase domain-containing protein [Sphingobium subterraneum]
MAGGAQLDAVASVESAGGGFQPDGLPKALFERH